MSKAELFPALHMWGISVPMICLWIGILILIPFAIYIANLFIETSTLRRFFIKIPILYGFALCEWKDFRNALSEISFKAFFASWPILISAFIYSIQHEDSKGAFTSNFQNGELYLFCGSMLATILYIAMKERRDANEDNQLSDKLLFPNRNFHILTVICLMFFSALIYALRKAGLFLPPYILVEVSFYYLLIVISLTLMASTINNALNGGNVLKYSIEATKSFNAKYEPGKGRE